MITKNDYQAAVIFINTLSQAKRHAEVLITTIDAAMNQEEIEGVPSLDTIHRDLLQEYRSDLLRVTKAQLMTPNSSNVFMDIFYEEAQKWEAFWSRNTQEETT